MNKIIELFLRFRVYINNYAWVIAGLVIRTIITIFILSRIANKIGIDDFGWYNLAISVFTVLFSLSTLGLNPSFVIKYFVKKDSDLCSILGTSLLARVVFSVFMLLLFALWILMSGAESNYWIILLVATSIIFQVSDLFTAFYQWKLKAKVYMGISISVLTLMAIFLILGLYAGYGLLYFLSIYVLERALVLIALVVVFHFTESKISKLKFDFDLLKSLLRQSWPLMLGAFLTAIYARFDQFLIKFFLSIESIGIYGTGIILSQIWYVVPSLIIPILYPKIAEKRAEGDIESYKKVTILLYGLLNYLALGIILFMHVFGEFIVVKLYGSEYIGSVKILKILIWTLIVLFQSHLTSSIMIIEGNEKYLFKVKLAGVLVNIILNIIFLKSYGIVFAAYSLIISCIISWIIMAFFNQKMWVQLKLNLTSFIVPFRLKKYMI